MKAKYDKDTLLVCTSCGNKHKELSQIKILEEAGEKFNWDLNKDNAKELLRKVKKNKKWNQHIQPHVDRVPWHGRLPRSRENFHTKSSKNERIGSPGQ